MIEKQSDGQTKTKALNKLLKEKTFLGKGAPIEKSAGCNKMTCNKCITNFCYLFGDIRNILGSTFWTVTVNPFYEDKDVPREEEEGAYMENQLTPDSLK
jgi:hypothetical protein